MSLSPVSFKDMSDILWVQHNVQTNVIMMRVRDLIAEFLGCWTKWDRVVGFGLLPYSCLLP